MGRDMQRYLISDFRGLGLSGDAARQPLRQISGTEFESYMAEVTNLHRPDGKLTNKNIGYVQHSPAPAQAGGKPYRLLGWYHKSDGTRLLIAVINGYIYTQDDADGTWNTEIASGLTEDAQYEGVQYLDWFIITNGTDSWLFDGTTLTKLFPTEPTASFAHQDFGAGSLTVVDSWHYTFTYYNSSTGQESTPNKFIESTGPFTGKEKVEIANIPGTDETGIDKIRLWRTVDEADPTQYRLLATFNNPGSGMFVPVYDDTTEDGDLSLVTIPLEDAIGAFPFKHLAAGSDRLWVAGISEEGIAQPNRVRVCHPGQPWRFDSFARTDECKSRIVALEDSDERGVLAFTLTEAYEFRQLGGGAIVAGPTGLPGTYSAKTVDAHQGLVAWLSGTQVYALIPGVGFRQLGDPPTRGSSIERWLTDVVSLEDSWIHVHGEYNYIMLGVAKLVSTPDQIAFYDLERADWWVLGYNGREPVRTLDTRFGSQPNVVLLGLDDGTLIKTFEGETAAGTVLKPRFKIGPTDLLNPNLKRMRNVQVFLKATGDINAKVTWTVDKGKKKGFDTSDIVLSGDRINVDFIVNVSSTVGPTIDRVFAAIGESARYIDVEFEELDGIGEFEIDAMHINWQDRPWP